ncbi:MAG TPA: iron-sulfur cluster insertion protein ErpA [Alphaproteobacteria bacterium]|nr:iron-sulfur cluster insertion protein ErpA [Alphaproteobacteria bacterium]
MNTTAPHLTDNAAQRIQALRQKEGQPALFLRLRVDSGGCNGFQYRFSLESAQNADDESFEHSGARLVVDKASLPFLNGAKIDYVSSLSGESFQVKNPSADSSCGCGSSFSPKI